MTPAGFIATRTHRYGRSALRIASLSAAFVAALPISALGGNSKLAKELQGATSTTLLT